MSSIRTFIARVVVRVALALAPAGSKLEADIRPIWRPGD